MSKTLLEVNNLKLYFRTSKGPVQAVDDVSFKLDRGKTLAVVGESGCGKTSLSKAILRLLPATYGIQWRSHPRRRGYHEVW